jgi:hypothetical protein
VIREGFGRGGGWAWARPEAAGVEQAETQPQAAVAAETAQPTPAVISPPIQPMQAQTQEAAG